MAASGAFLAAWRFTLEIHMMNSMNRAPLHVQTPTSLDAHHLEILKGSTVLDVWANHPGETVDSGPIEVPAEVDGVTLVVAAGRWSSITIEGSQDGGVNWERMAAMSSMLGNVVATYAHRAAFGGIAGVRLTHLRVRASRAGKGVVKVGLEVMRL